MNILYCFDENYNKQALISIFSLLNNNQVDFDFFIIHNNPESFKKELAILNHGTNIKFHLYQFVNKNNIELPFTKESHVSDATYYRLFFQDYLPSSVKNILYLDADVICLNNIESIVQNTFRDLNQSDYVFAASTVAKKKDNKEMFKKLDINTKYFNAGVMFVEYNKWIDNDLSNKLQNHISTIKDKIIWWDQDVMNNYFDGNYMEISTNLNYILGPRTRITDFEKMKKNIFFLHYAGKNKPWKIKEFINYQFSIYFQDYCLKLFQNYFFEFKSKKNLLENILRGTLNLKIFKLKKPIMFYRLSIQRLFKND